MACITNNGRILVDGLEGRRSLEVISAIYESIETGREIHLPFVPERCRLGRRTLATTPDGGGRVL